MLTWIEAVVAEVERRGHLPEPDDPHELSSGARLTCSRPGCGRAVLNYRGNIYGSALTEDCVGDGGDGRG